MKKKIFIFIILLLGTTSMPIQKVYGQNDYKAPTEKTKDDGTTNNVDNDKPSKTETSSQSKSSGEKQQKNTKPSKRSERFDNSNKSNEEDQEDESSDANQNNNYDNDVTSSYTQKSEEPATEDNNAMNTNNDFHTLPLYKIGGYILAFVIIILLIGISFFKSRDALKATEINYKKLRDLDVAKNQMNISIRNINEQIAILKKQMEEYSSKLQRQNYQQNNDVGINIDSKPQYGNYRPNNINRQPITSTYYLGAPNNAGLFSAVSESRSYESIFKLTTRDGKIGTFIFINDRDSINTATLAVEAIKIAFKINNIGIQPSRVITNIEGCAEQVNGQWIITSKGLITFEV